MKESKVQLQKDCEGSKEGEIVKGPLNGNSAQIQGDKIAQFDQIISALIQSKMNAD